MIFGCSYLLVLNLFKEKLILEIETQFFSKIGNILKRKSIEKNKIICKNSLGFQHTGIVF